jgi:ribosomal protein L11 methyltransferase
MKYLEFTFTTCPCTETVNDVLVALLGDVGFDSFTDNEGGIKAYIQAAVYDEATLDTALRYFPLPDTDIRYTQVEAEDKDWNEEWEKTQFQPIVIDGRCVIHSADHTDIPKAEYDICINPQMAFGTGTHATTGLIVGELLNLDLQGKAVLDMGCGTSILGILARMRGARSVTAIDVDTWSVNNSHTNIALNAQTDIEVVLGDAGALEGRGPFDVVLANINRNILLSDLPRYVSCAAPKAVFLLSGFYTEDMALLCDGAAVWGLRYVSHRVKNEWAMLRLEKETVPLRGL